MVDDDIDPKDMGVKGEYGMREECNEIHSDVKIERFKSEIDMLREFVQLVRRIDPDLLIGYEIQNNSFGYIIERSRHLSIPFILSPTFHFP